MTYKPHKIAEQWYLSEREMVIAPPSLGLHPTTDSTIDIVKCFLLGKPLTPDQIHYLDWHRIELSNSKLDPILKYYLKSSHNKEQQDLHTSLLLPHAILNRDAIASLKKRIDAMIKQSATASANVVLSKRQFLSFRRYTIQDLIFWHGNQFLTGAPFYLGGIHHVIYFQWGNYFGIIKLMNIPGERAGTGNLLLHFEELKERTLEQCVFQYQKHEQEQIKVQEKLRQQNEYETEQNRVTLTHIPSCEKGPTCKC